MKYALFVAVVMSTVACSADEARFGAFVVDATTGDPISGANVKSWFETDIGWRAWNESPPVVTDEGVTDAEGLCRQKGKTNTGEVTCHAELSGKYYRGVFFRKLSSKNLFGVWQPDNLVATIRLQRVEYPIPLFVKYETLRDGDKGIGTNVVLRFDLKKGEWLPPYGHGETADMQISSELKITDKERKFRHATKKVEDVLFYELVNRIRVGGKDDYICAFDADRNTGIKIRKADDRGCANEMTKVRGMRKKTSKNKNWHCEYFSDTSQDRCYTFRIRSKRNDKGELVEAYYGKIYGDFAFEGDDKKGLIGVNFLYYLNPTPLDRNLEWDMKNNLCPVKKQRFAKQP